MTTTEMPDWLHRWLNDNKEEIEASLKFWKAQLVAAPTTHEWMTKPDDPA